MPNKDTPAESEDPQPDVTVGPEGTVMRTIDTGGLGLDDGGLSLEEFAQRTHPDRYRVQGEVGRGGMGAVLSVFDKDLRRNLAMKVAISGDGDPGIGRTPPIAPQRLARFLEEAQVTGQLDHPGVVPVHEFGVDANGRVYFTMRLVRGVEFSEIIRRVHSKDGEASSEWSMTRALGVLLRVAEAMAYAHHKRVVHRDLKPANVMVGQHGEVYVMDWGLAQIEGRDPASDLRFREPAGSLSSVRTDRGDAADSDPDSPLLTQDGTVLGTPYYMPPEQAKGRVDQLGPRSDVYSLGAILYHLLSGRMPYHEPGDQPSGHTVLAMVVLGPPQPLGALAPRVPQELVSICERAMAREFEQRYADMGELADDLRAFLEGRVVRAHQVGALAEFRKWVLRNRLSAAAVAGLCIAVLAGLVGFSYVQSANARQVDSINQNLLLANEETSDALARAEAETQRAEKVQAFLKGMLSSVRPGSGVLRDASALEILDQAARDLDEQFEDSLAVKAELQQTLGLTYGALGLHAKGEDLLVAGLETLRRYQPRGSQAEATDLMVLCHYVFSGGFQGSIDAEGATALARQCVAMGREFFEEDSPEFIMALSLEPSVTLAKVLQENTVVQGAVPDYIAVPLGQLWFGEDFDLEAARARADQLFGEIERAWVHQGPEAADRIVERETDPFLENLSYRTNVSVGGLALARWAEGAGRMQVAQALYHRLRRIMDDYEGFKPHARWTVWKEECGFLVRAGLFVQAAQSTQALVETAARDHPEDLSARVQALGLLAEARLGAGMENLVRGTRESQLLLAREDYAHGGQPPSASLLDLAAELSRLGEHEAVEALLLEAWDSLEGLRRRLKRTLQPRCADALLAHFEVLGQPERAAPFREFASELPAGTGR